jgi:hypothetical protein
MVYRNIFLSMDFLVLYTNIRFFLIFFYILTYLVGLSVFI